MVAHTWCAGHLREPRTHTSERAHYSKTAMQNIAVCCLLLWAGSLTCTVSLVSQRTHIALRSAPLEVLARRQTLESSRGIRLEMRVSTARLRGGADDSETETETEDEKPGVPLAAKAKPAVEESEEDEADDEEAESSGIKEKDQEEGEGEGEGEGGEDGGEKGEGGEPEEEQRPPPTPEMIRMMNERLWEAALEGNEPLAQKAIEGGADVNAFCRGPDKWVNISVGEIAGADDAHTGLNVHWMELNNYTAMHLAAASGNAAVIDKLLEAGGDINVECLQRIHPFPSCFGSHVPLVSVAAPVVYKCTPLRLARASNCGRCFFTSYQKSVDKLEAAGAVDKDLHFPFNTVVMGLALGGAWLGLKQWPFSWFREWPYNWADYPDMAPYLDK